MFERFTDRARRVVTLAQEEATRLDHGYIGTEHILLGLIREGEGAAAQALEALGISLDAAGTRPCPTWPNESSSSPARSNGSAPCSASTASTPEASSRRYSRRHG
jgi:ATP-dependent Clp protease ATP-binding subunit ClpA